MDSKEVVRTIWKTIRGLKTIGELAVLIVATIKAGEWLEQSFQVPRFISGGVILVLAYFIWTLQDWLGSDEPES